MSLCHQLDDYLDRDLSAVDGQAFEEHLLECAACRLAVAECGQMYGMLASDSLANDSASHDVSADAIAAGIQSQLSAAAIPAGQGMFPRTRLWSVDEVDIDPAEAERGDRRRFGVRSLAWVAAAAVLLTAVVMTFEFMGEEGDLAQAPPLRWQPPAAVMSDGAALAQAKDQTNADGDSQQHIGGTNNQITAVADRASFVRQVGDSPYEQLSVKSENPNVTIVWLMEPPKQADDSPRP